MKLRKSHILMIGSGAAVVLVVAFVLFTLKKGDAKPMGGRRGGSVVSVQTMKLEPTTLHAYVSTNGEIESQTSIEVFPDMGGKIEQILVALGSQVKRGQVIGWIDPSEPGIRYEKSPIVAPISGNIISTPLKRGTTVSPNKVITEIGDVENLQIRANVPERFIAVLKTGLKAKIRLEAYPDEFFNATVSRVSPVVDVASRTKEIILHFDKKDQRVNAGMFAKVILFTEDYAGEVVMPESGIVNKENKTYAFVVKDDLTVNQREITTGKIVDGMVQVLTGLNEGEFVVTAGQTSLAEGSKVIDLSGNIKPKSAGDNPNAGEKSPKGDNPDAGEKRQQ